MINGTIRKYRDPDYEQIAIIFHNAVHELAVKDYNLRQLEAWAPYNYDLDAWRQRCEEKQPYVFENEGKLVGYIEMDPDGHIDQTYVSPAFAGKGAMHQLMNHVKSIAKENSVNQLYSEVSITAKPFFERHGFVYSRDNKVERNGVEFLNTIMVCDL